MRRSLPLLILPLLALPLLAGCGPSSDEFTAVGSTAPDFHVETLVAPSTTASLGRRRGKVVLLDFWATWCGPCKEILPAIEAIHAKYKDRGFEVMAITDEAREIVALNERNHPHKVPVYLDAEDGAHKAFGVSSLPTILVVDREGHVVYGRNGITDATAAELEAAVSKALGQA